MAAAQHTRRAAPRRAPKARYEGHSYPRPRAAVAVASLAALAFTLWALLNDSKFEASGEARARGPTRPETLRLPEVRNKTFVPDAGRCVELRIANRWRRCCLPSLVVIGAMRAAAPDFCRLDARRGMVSTRRRASRCRYSASSTRAEVRFQQARRHLGPGALPGEAPRAERGRERGPLLLGPLRVAGEAPGPLARLRGRVPRLSGDL
mmetsp:Transcript_29232/g.87412  ORF Transcript_29232/g.87412 Transcript_29232/m.87412 type:complete len:207 (+) Transcript_29232:1104-1724(+)